MEEVENIREETCKDNPIYTSQCKKVRYLGCSKFKNFSKKFCPRSCSECNKPPVCRDRKVWCPMFASETYRCNQPSLRVLSNLLCPFSCHKC